MPRITVIPSTFNPETHMPTAHIEKRKVAAYARVSTDLEEQVTSYKAQVDYYTKYIKKCEDWDFVRVYTDEGISGTSTKKHEVFQQMISDALGRKINLIITKSVSRFARNMVDSLSTIRLLKGYDVEVYFQKENIFTFDSNGELMISILSSLAQEESRSISENVTWGQRKRFADGKVTMPYSSFLGYRKGADGLPEIVPEEAKIVRYIYRRFIAGLTTYKIASELTAQGIPTPAGKEKWAGSTIKSILTNEKYKGDALLQKKFTVDFLTKKQKINEGEIPQYYVENSHPAIITPEEFDFVQEEFMKRASNGKQYNSTSAFASKIICGDCDSYFSAKVWHSNSKYRCVIYQCNSKFKGGHFCTTTHLYESEIQQKFLNAFSQYFEQKEVVIRNCLFVLNQLKLQNEHNAELQAEFDEINEQLKEYIEIGGKDTDYGELNAHYEEIAAKIDAEEQLAAKRKGRIAKMQEILRVLKKSDSILETFYENIWTILVETLTVFHDSSMVFLFKDGTEIKI